MRSTLLFVIAILFGFGILFARDRLKRAFQVGAALYAVTLVVRFVVFGSADADNLVELAAVVAVVGLFWGLAWAVTTAILRYRKRRVGSRD